MDRPRILDVPDIEAPLPALGGITIEPAQVAEVEKRPGIDVPLQTAPLGSRVLAFLVDGLIVGAAAALFGFIFWKVAEVRPPQMQMVGATAGMLCLFWVAYQYLLIVHAASTPGLRLAGLQLDKVRWLLDDSVASPPSRIGFMPVRRSRWAWDMPGSFSMRIHSAGTTGSLGPTSRPGIPSALAENYPTTQTPL